MRRLHSVQKRWLVKRRQLVVLEATTYTKDIWAAAIGEVLVYSQEPTNTQKFSLGKIIFV